MAAEDSIAGLRYESPEKSQAYMDEFLKNDFFKNSKKIENFNPENVIVQAHENGAITATYKS